MPGVAAVITTVNHPQKQEWVKDVISNISSLPINFHRKIISVDMIDHHEYLADTIEFGNNHGWEWSFVYHRNRVSSLIDEIQKLQDYDYILHAEDDIILNKIPSDDIVNNLFLNQCCGILTPSNGGTYLNDIDRSDINYAHKNCLYNNNEMMIYTRDIEFSNNFFFELGTFFINPKLFLQCLLFAKSIPQMQIEHALSVAWVYNKIHLHYYKATWCRSDMLDIYKNNPESFQQISQYTTILDPMQGSSWYAGLQTTT